MNCIEKHHSKDNYIEISECNASACTVLSWRTNCCCSRHVQLESLKRNKQLHTMQASVGIQRTDSLEWRDLVRDTDLKISTAALKLQAAEPNPEALLKDVDIPPAAKKVREMTADDESS